MQLKTVRRWTDKENNVIKENYLKLSDQEIGEMIDRTEKAVLSQRQKLNLYRPQKKIISRKRAEKNKLTFDDIRNIMFEKDYELLSNESEYINNSSKMRYVCNKHRDNGEQYITVGHLKQGEGCKYCGREKSGLARLSSISEEDDKLLCESKGFEYVRTEKINDIYYIFFVCAKHEILGILKMRRGNMSRTNTKGCQYCFSKNLPHWYVKHIIEASFSNINVLSEYQGMNKPLTCYCNVHKKEFTNLAKYVYFSGTGCNECARDKLVSNRLLPKEEVIQRVYEKNKNIDILNIESYSGVKLKLQLKCRTCGSIWEQGLDSIMMHSCRCPVCDSSPISIGELIIAEYLLSQNIVFIPQYSFDDCKYIKKLRFDFAIFDSFNQVKGLIEFQGEQHYKVIEHFGGEEGFQERIIRDRIKVEYCNAHNIPLLIIPYQDILNIDNILNNFITNL